MDWSDTLLFEPHLKAKKNSATSEVVQIFPAQGVTLLQAKVRSEQDKLVAMRALSGFRAAGRRVVLCDTSSLGEEFRAVERQLGHALVQEGGAEVVVSCGTSAREVAIGARDEGLPLANVVVCSDDRSACEVLTNQMAPGDTVLLLGIEDDIRARLVLSLENRLGRTAAAA